MKLLRKSRKKERLLLFRIKYMYVFPRGVAHLRLLFSSKIVKLVAYNTNPVAQSTITST